MRRKALSGSSGQARETAFDQVARELTDRSWSVMPDFLGPVACASLVTEIEEMRAAQALIAAGVGINSGRQVRPQTRTNLVHWLEEPTNSPAQQTAWSGLDLFRVGLNRRLFLGLERIEAHLALFEPDGRYAKHVDNFHHSSRRVVSCVLYLNPAWVSADGGELRIYERADHDQVALDVAPTCGTLACFLSSEIAHEVLRTAKDRYSITAWFSRREDVI